MRRILSQVLDSSSKTVWSLGSGDPMARYRTDPNALNIPWVHSPFFEDMLAHLPLSTGPCRLARQYRELGYVVIEEPIIPSGDVVE